MRIHLFLFLAFGVLVMMGGSSEVQGKVRKAEKSGSVEQKKDMKQKSPLKITNKGLKTQAQVKSSEKVDISYEGFFTRGDKRGRVSGVFQNAQSRRVRRTFRFMKTGERMGQGFSSADPNRLERLNEKIGASPATFTNEGVVSFKGAKKRMIRSRSSLESQRK